MEAFINALKERAGFFLLQMGEFKPFRVFFRSGEVVDTVKAYETFSETQIYDFLIKEVKLDLADSEITASAIVLTGQSDGYDVVVIEIFRNRRKKYQVVFPYTINNGTIIFGPDLNQSYQTDKDW
ncbi:hypothetical protein DRF60_06350 [Chryseobacterium elymi]|uniref:Uncharacterized protein n=1 Tax=Chryseobacterium elymi TaxID=395936 RepID=A0A3D9DN32_9FLAO|nr:hypothetical protein [Chryseobacterium elymi]REC79440.1 hypothetical protein DRF60_06350 [Chryseobacterium elymi]